MNKQKAFFEIHLAVLLFGLAGLFGKWLTLSPFIIVLGRVFFASISLALLLWISKQRIIISTIKDYPLFILLGLILSVHWVTFFKSIQVSTVAIGLLSYSSFPVFTTFLEPLFLREKIVKRNIFHAFFCVVGVFLIIPKFDLANSTYQGVLWGLVSGLTFSILTILNRKLSQRFSNLLIAFYQDFFATLFLFPFFFVIQPALNPNNILLLCVLGVLCTAGSHSLFIKGMRFIKAQTASILSSLEPVYGIILAFLFLREIPSLRTVLGGAVILWAVFSVTIRGTED